jgi:PAS domain S-box-containing protein
MDTRIFFLCCLVERHEGDIMEDCMRHALNTKDHLSALKIIGVYAIVAILYFFFIDTLFDSIIGNDAFILGSSVLKALLFLVVTAALLYQLIARHLEQLRQREDELRTNLNLINFALQGTTDVIYIKDRDGRYLLCNPAAAQVTGKTAEEVLGNDDTSVFQDEQAQRIMEYDQQVMKAGCVITYEECLTTADGTDRTFLSTKGPIFDESGAIFGLFGISRDITRRKQAEKMLLDSEERYRRLFEVESDAVLLVDCETDRIIDANKAALELYDYSKVEFLLLNVCDLSAEPDKTRQAIAAQQTRIPFRWHRKKNGTIFPVEIAGSYFKYRERNIHVAAIRDIHERIQAEIALHDSEERLSLAMDASRTGVWEWDLNSGAALCSPECLIILGIASFGGKVQSFIDAVHPEDANRVIHSVNQAIAEIRDYNSEFRIIRPSGEVRWVSHRGRPKYDESDKPLRMIGTIQDITERKHSENSVVESEKKYRELVERLIEGVWVIDDSDNTIFLTPRMAEMLGYTVNEMLGKNLCSFMDRLDREMVRSYLHSHKSVIMERRRFDFHKKDGTILHTSVSVSRRSDSNSNYTGAMICLVDITERLQLEQRVQHISLTERHRLGRDLHDDLGQHLTGIAFMAKVLTQKLTLKSSEETADAASLLNLVNEAINKTRSLARGLCPMEPGAENFISGLKALAAKTESMYGISCSVNVDNAIRIKDNNKSMQLYYIAGEAISNAIRHGKATNISISLAAADGKISFTIRDNGAGLPKPLNFDKGMGLDIMTYRAGMMNAWLNIHNAPSGGTVVSCTFKESDGRAGGITQ